MVIILPLRRGCFHLGNTRIPTMDLKKLFTEERAVSPVIGVILMVAITVILAAVIGAFVLGLGGDTQETPSASIEFDLNVANGDNTIEVEHRGGASFNTGEITVAVDGTALEGDELGDYNNADSVVRSGNITTLTEDSDGQAEFNEGSTIVIIHDPSDGTIARDTL